MAARDSLWRDSVPSIVLLIGPDSELLQTYVACFEASGLWVARCSGVTEAPQTIDEIKPNAIIIAGLASRPVDELIEDLRSETRRQMPPLIVLTPSPQSELAPETVLQQIRAFLEPTATKRGSEAFPAPPEEAPAAKDPSGCPECGRSLEFVERTRLYGTEYDYYRWCMNGCGLYCYNRDARTWVRLA